MIIFRVHFGELLQGKVLNLGKTNKNAEKSWKNGQIIVNLPWKNGQNRPVL